jgi:hypothetical protein
MLCTDDLSGLELDTGQLEYTFKPLGAAVWALRRACTVLPPDRVRTSLPMVRQRLFEGLVTEVVMAGGDTAGNANVAGYVLGAFFGYDGLPSQWCAGLEHGEWLGGKVDRACHLLGLLGPLPPEDELTDDDEAPICPAQDFADRCVAPSPRQSDSDRLIVADRR